MNTTLISAIIFAQRKLNTTERFGWNSLFLLFGLFLCWVGVRAIRTRTFPMDVISMLIFSKQEWKGWFAVFKGVVYILLGLAFVGGCIAMMILGRTLLP
jgi:hypothetical protein